VTQIVVRNGAVKCFAHLVNNWTHLSLLLFIQLFALLFVLSFDLEFVFDVSFRLLLVFHLPKVADFFIELLDSFVSLLLLKLPDGSLYLVAIFLRHLSFDYLHLLALVVFDLTQH